MKILLTYLATLPIFLAVDLVWIGLVARNFYFKSIPGIAEQANWPAALIFYLIYIAGIIAFVVWPNLGKSWTTVAAYGAFFGLVAYATYDLTNYAVMKNWPLSITLVDLAWGSALTAIVAVLSFLVTKKFIV